VQFEYCASVACPDVLPTALFVPGDPRRSVLPSRNVWKLYMQSWSCQNRLGQSVRIHGLCDERPHSVVQFQGCTLQASRLALRERKRSKSSFCSADQLRSQVRNSTHHVVLHRQYMIDVVEDILCNRASLCFRIRDARGQLSVHGER